MDAGLRNKLALESIAWKGDLSDNWAAAWAGLTLRAEWKDNDSWWWSIYDTERGDAIVDVSNNYDEPFVSRDATRKKAELVAKSYIVNITQPITGKFSITDVFKITGRGLVLVGHLKEGSILAGDMIDFTAFGIIFQRKIGGVDFPRTSLLLDPPLIGLLIKCKDEDEIDKLRSWKFENQIACLFKQ